ncbi:MAG: 2-dehydropantoate 2-reductase, partial [Flavobacteriaceae bacterium]|nr:2-dehydropantoate 2-reductase [Flavobacteriaceae bacterium]
MKIVVYGTGGVGGFFGGKIANAGYDITFIARGEHLKAIEKSGLQVKSIDGSFTVYPNATDAIEEIKDADLILLGVKSWQIT